MCPVSLFSARSDPLCFVLNERLTEMHVGLKDENTFHICLFTCFPVIQHTCQLQETSLNNCQGNPTMDFCCFCIITVKKKVVLV